jgi:hypothetical protein
MLWPQCLMKKMVDCQAILFLPSMSVYLCMDLFNLSFSRNRLRRTGGSIAVRSGESGNRLTTELEHRVKALRVAAVAEVYLLSNALS